jgi:hypothetical protein
MKTTLGIIIVILTLTGYLQAQIQQNVLDASPQVGTGGFNRPVQTYQPNYSAGMGNLYITGNVTGGKQFRGYVPYTDPSQFQGTLGSNYLNNFQRQSVDVNQVNLGESSGIGVTMPYYSQSSTILPVTAISQNYNLPGSSTPRSQILPQTPSYLSGATLSQSYTKAIQKDLPTDMKPSDILIPTVATPELQPGDEMYTKPIQMPTEVQTTLKPEELEQPKAAEEYIQPITPETLQPGQEAPKDFTTWVNQEAEKADMQQQSQVLVGPQKEYAESAKRLAVQGKALQAAPGTATQPSAIIKPSKRIPVITSLAGSGRDDFSRTMQAAQKLMNQNRFYDAYYKFSDAHARKADNPLPLFGQANALIAAGDLREAANILQSAIEKFPKFLLLKFDGSHLLGSKAILDRRCKQAADLLQKNDDASLKLIAGYLDILAGNRDEGFKLINDSGLLKKQ